MEAAGFLDADHFFSPRKVRRGTIPRPLDLRVNNFRGETPTTRPRAGHFTRLTIRNVGGEQEHTLKVALVVNALETVKIAHEVNSRRTVAIRYKNTLDALL